VQYFIESAVESIPDPEDLIQATIWDVIWARLATDRFYDMRGNRGVSNCGGTVPMDAETVDVRFCAGKRYVSYS
jgi:hypothetical protein